jgi:hypothetical protein
MGSRNFPNHGPRVCVLWRRLISEEQKIKQKQKNALFYVTKENKRKIKLLSTHNLTSTHFSLLLARPVLPHSLSRPFRIYSSWSFTRSKVLPWSKRGGWLVCTSCRYKYLTENKKAKVVCGVCFHFSKVFCFIWLVEVKTTSWIHWKSPMRIEKKDSGALCKRF